MKNRFIHGSSNPEFFMIASKEEREREQMQIFNCDSQPSFIFKII